MTSVIFRGDYQCIYDFKDSSADKLIKIYEDENNPKIPHTHICYRCPDKLVEHATNLILQNKKRASKSWNKSGKLGDITHSQHRSFEDVAQSIFQTISNLDKSCTILILSPVEFVASPIIKKLEQENLDFENYFTKSISTDLISKAWEVRSKIGKYKYLNLVLLAYSILKDRKKFYQYIKEDYDVGENYDRLLELLTNKFPEFLTTLTSMEDCINHERYTEIFELYTIATGNNSDEKIENIFNIKNETEEKNIKIMTIHKSKGLQADYVFMIGLNEGIIPNVGNGNDTLEAQRRLFYVGITRAKTQLFLYSNIYIEGKLVNKVDKSKFRFDVNKRLWQGRASTFISELKLT